MINNVSHKLCYINYFITSLATENIDFVSFLIDLMVKLCGLMQKIHCNSD